MDIRLDPAGGAPVYMQLAEAVLKKIERGELAPGDQLPTVREMSRATGLAPGTVRHAYDALVRGGAVDMAQGRGTFVKAVEPGGTSRQKQAQTAIEALLDRMDELGFTPREVSMYLSLALRQRGAVKKLIPVAVVDCNPESVRQVALQLSFFSGVELSEFLLEDVRGAAGGLLDAYPLIVTTQTHGHELTALMGGRQDAIGKVVLSPSAETIMELSRVSGAEGALIYCETPRFAQIVRNGLRLFPNLAADARVVIAGTAPLEERLHGAQVLLAPPDYLSFASAEDAHALERFALRGGAVVKYHHQIDRGSLMYIEDRIKALAQG